MSQSSAAERHEKRQEMTLAEWGAMGEDEPGELVDGLLVEEEEVGLLHDVVAGWLVWALKAWLGSRGGLVGVSDTRFGVAPRRGRKPDVYLYLPGRKPAPHGLVTEPPDVIIEIVSPRPRDARRDRIEKMRDYAVFRVPYYWIVDPAIRTFEILELGADGRYTHAASAAQGTIAAPGFEGLVIDVDALWAEVDQLAPEPEVERSDEES